MSFYDQYGYPNPKNYVVHRNKPDGIFHIANLAPRDWDGNILVIGSGSVEALLIANANPDGMVTGIDVSPYQIKTSKSIRRKHKIKNIKFRLADITKDSRREYFDHVVATGVLHHIPDINDALENIKNKMHLGSTLTGMVYCKDRPQYIRPLSKFFIENNYKPADIIEWFEDNTDHPAYKWYRFHVDTPQEIADTWLNPYWVEYSYSELKELLGKFFDMVLIAQTPPENINQLLFFKAYGPKTLSYIK